MREEGPSVTALAAAAHRAAHQLVENGSIFSDPHAVAITGMAPERLIEQAHENEMKRGMRFFIVCRSALAEAALAEAVEQRGVTQLVVLGAGLDTFAYRNPLGDRIRIFEVDHAATQAWKRHRLQDIGIAIPEWLTFAPVNFETDRLLDRLVAAGFDPEQRSFFFMLGIVPYLTDDANRGTIGTVGSLPGGAEIALDYGDPPDGLEGEMLQHHQERAARVAAVGEPFLSAYTADAMADMLHENGFATIDDYGLRRLAERFFPPAAPYMPEQGAHVVLARTD